MRIAAFLFVLAALVFSVGCGMSGPGIAKIQAPPPDGYVAPARIPGVHPDNSWVKPHPHENAAFEPHLSEDISERELGAKPLSKDLTVDEDGNELAGAAARQEMRRQARQAELRARMGLQSSKPHAEGEKPKK